MELTTGVIVGSIVVIVVVIYHLKRLKLYRAAAQFAGPTTWPLIGNINLGIGLDIDDGFDEMMSYLDKYLSLCRFWLGHKLVIAVYEPEHVEAVLYKCLDKHEFYRFGIPLLGTGLVTAPESKWRKHRKIIQPTFNRKVLDTFIQIFEQPSKILVDQLRSRVGGEEFEILDYLSLCTLDMVCETTMGVQMNAQYDKNSKYVTYQSEMVDIATKRVVRPWLYPDFIYNRSKLGMREKRIVEYMHEFTDKVIQNKRLQFNKLIGEISKELPDESFNKRKIFLDHLMQLSHEGDKLTDQELRDEVNTMVAAGYETISVTSVFVLLMLATHPEIQSKAYEEVRRLYAQKNPNDEGLSSKDLSELEYLERVIKETQRLFPIVPVILRKINEDIEVDSKILPKGSSVCVVLPKTHRVEKYWPNPLEFNPDRFLPEEVAKRHSHAFIPFNAGPRNCIGQVYAMMAMKVLLANILKEYIVKKDEPIKVQDIKLRIGMTMKPANPINIKIEKRTLM